MDLKWVVCPGCLGSGRDRKKRKRICPDCNGSGQAPVCGTCGLRYNVPGGCMDTMMDQTYCGTRDR